jgi:hypothetical protein
MSLRYRLPVGYAVELRRIVLAYLIAASIHISDTGKHEHGYDDVPDLSSVDDSESVLSSPDIDHTLGTTVIAATLVFITSL